MFKKLIFIILLTLSINPCFTQPSKTKLMVGIIVDQMRPDYLQRFYNQLGEKGFKRLLNEGFICQNTHINYFPSVTAVGHASIYSGTSPKYHGIIENEWFDRNQKKVIYSVYDTTVFTIGNPGIPKKSYSARNLLTTNISDELKLGTNFKGKVFAMSLKDRGATMPGGHLADGAFWFDQNTGNFISSTYYVSELPPWVTAFNEKKYADKYLENVWNLLLPEDEYAKTSFADDNSYESLIAGKNKPTFPYNLKEMSKFRKVPYYGIYASPYGSTLLTDLAIEALKNAGIGNDAYPDILAISYSGTDAVGHLFGPQSRELNDIYLHLDNDLARLLDALDKYIGKDNYTLFLTADHGVGEIPAYLKDHNIPAGYIDTAIFVNEIREKLSLKFGPGKWLENYVDANLYLNRSLAQNKGIPMRELENYLAGIVREITGVAEVYTKSQLEENNYATGIGYKVQIGFYPERCGDVVYILKANWNEKYATYVANHGSPYDFDTHIPLIWFGAGISKGSTYKPLNITDIAPTISVLLHIKNPGSCIGNPIVEIVSH
jgi:predicted AlkP superfamily pyrophosphatase or phosphodiesterase